MTRDSLERLARGELESGQLASALRHVSSCAQCAALGEEAFAEDAAGLHEALSHEVEDEHPDLLPYIDGSIDRASREIVETHLEDCETCRMEVADLNELVRLMRRKPRRDWTWLAVAAVIAMVIAVAILMNARRQPTPESPPVVRAVPPVETAVTPPAKRYANARWAVLVAEAMKSKRLPFPKDLDTLRGNADALRGSGGDGTVRIAPAGVVVDETRPRFSWPSVDDATYVVSIFDDDQRIAQSEPLRETAWQPPRDLPRGRTLVWQVEASHDGNVDILPAPPAPLAMFRITGAREHAELELAKREHPDDPLLLAVLYAEAGLREDALRELQRSGSFGVAGE